MSATVPGTPSTVAQAQRAATALGVDRLDAQLLLLHALGHAVHDRAWLVAHDADPMPDAAWRTLASHCARRLAGEPVAYLIGEKEFHGLALRVDARVLVPRPDTETLVDWALDVLDAMRSAAPLAVLDLGTGSGAIALALRHARPDVQVDALDASEDALAVAKGNAQRLGLDVRFFEGNWLAEGGVYVDAAYDLIVSNPPYIADGDPHLPALAHEPLRALVAGADGLADIRRIVRDAPTHLRAGGWLLLEHGLGQASAVGQLLAAHGFVDIASCDDLAGIARCTGGRRPG